MRGDWRIVPVEPTLEMLTAGARTRTAGDRDFDADDTLRPEYRAMIAGARHPSLNVAELRLLLPDGYEILPVAVIEELAYAGHVAYLPAFGGSEAALASVNNAARAADNVLARYQERRRRPGSQGSLE